MKTKKLTAKEQRQIAAARSQWETRPQWSAIPDELSPDELAFKAKAVAAFTLPAAVNLGSAPAPAPPPSAIVKAVTRFENNRADSPFSRSRIPRHGLKPGWNLEEAPRVEFKESTARPLSAASLARMARMAGPAATATGLAPRKEIHATLAQGEDKVIFLPTGKFKTLKNGELREIKTRVEIWNRSVTLGTTLYRFSSRAKAVTLETVTDANREGDFSKVNDAEILPGTFRRTRDQIESTFRRILPADEAAAAIRHLFRL